MIFFYLDQINPNWLYFQLLGKCCFFFVQPLCLFWCVFHIIDVACFNLQFLLVFFNYQFCHNNLISLLLIKKLFITIINYSVICYSPGFPKSTDPFFFLPTSPQRDFFQDNCDPQAEPTLRVCTESLEKQRGRAANGSSTARLKCLSIWSRTRRWEQQGDGLLAK